MTVQPSKRKFTIVMDSIEESLRKLLSGEVVPITEVDASYYQQQNAGAEPSFIPKVKKNITYIVMAVLFDEKDRVVLVQEAKSSCRGSWYLPAGRVEKGENLIDGVKREVLEEACLEFEPLSLIGLQISVLWYRFLYVGRAVGGKLKSLAEQDSESLQANWFTLEQIEKGFVQLRAKDILKPIRHAYEYVKTSEENRHPRSSILIQPHKHMIHRSVICKQNKDGAFEVLCCKKNGLHVPSCYSYDPLHISAWDILQAAFREEFLGKAAVQGLLTIEHCGVPAHEHDGICVTSVVTFTSRVDSETIEQPKNSDYVWCSISDRDILTELQRRLIEKKLLPVVWL